MNEDIQKKAINAVKHTLIFKIIGQLCGSIATILLVRVLSEKDYGVYNLLYSVIALISTIASFGIGNMLQRYIPEYYQKGEFKVACNLYRMASAIRLIADVVILGLILILWQEIAPILKLTEYKPYFMLFTLVILLYHQQQMLLICLSSYFLHKYSKPIAVVFSIIKAAGYGMIFFFDKNLWYAIAIDLSAYSITLIFLQVLYFNKVPSNGGNMNIFSRQEKKRLARYAFFYNFNDSGLGLLNADFDNFIIAIFLNPAAVGTYAFYVRLNTHIISLLPLKYFRDVIKPAFFSIKMSSQSTTHSNLFFQNLVKINFIFAIPCLCFLLIFTKDIVTVLFDSKFIESSSVLAGIYFFSMINSIPFGTVAQFREKPDIILYSKIFAVYNLIADIILIKFFGIWGAIVATGTATMAKNCFIWYFIRDDANFKEMMPFFIKIFLFWIVISMGVHNITQVFPYDGIYQLAFGILIFSVCFFIQFRCNYFKDNEKKIFAKLSEDNKKMAFIFTKLMHIKLV